jgi:hypothetical protein
MMNLPKCNLKVPISPRFKLKNQLPPKTGDSLSGFENLNLKATEQPPIPKPEKPAQKQIVMDFTQLQRAIALYQQK